LRDYHPEGSAMTKENKPKFLLSIEMNVELSVEELWPDGDGPENPTEEDVVDLINAEGGVPEILNDWNLSDLVKIYVSKVK